MCTPKIEVQGSILVDAMEVQDKTEDVRGFHSGDDGSGASPFLALSDPFLNLV